MNKIDQYLADNDPIEIKEYVLSEIQDSGVDFEDTIMEAHDITLLEAGRKNPMYIHKNWMAETMYGNMVGLFTEKYPDRMHFDEHGCRYLLLSTDIRVYFKKLDKKYKPSNVQTGHVVDLWSQNGGSYGSRIHTFYVGYRILDDKVWDNIIGIFGAYPNNFFRKKIDWIVDMSGLAGNIAIPIKPVNSDPDGEDFQLIPKQTPKQKEGEI